MPLDPILADMIAAARQLGLPSFADGSADDARAIQLARRAARGLPPPRPEIGSIEPLNLPGPHGIIPARLYLPKGNPRGIIVYFHGGGWVVGDLESVDASSCVLVDESGWGVLSVDYRLAPEHRFPQPLDDAYAAIGWAAREYRLPVIAGGDSAGANLAAASCLRARDDADFSITGQILFYPVTDHDFETPSYRQNGDKGYAITTRDMQWFWDQYVSVEERGHPHASPLRAAEFAGLPPAFVVVAGYDPLRDEGIAYADRLRDADVPVELRHYASMIHGFATMIGVVPQAEAALREAGRWAATLAS